MSALKNALDFLYRCAYLPNDTASHPIKPVVFIVRRTGGWLNVINLETGSGGETRRAHVDEEETPFETSSASFCLNKE
jgi:hypothetical protein